MTLVGFKRMHIGVLKDGKVDGDLIVIEGNENEGATVTAEISGLSSEAVKVYGSDIAYYVAQKGTGDVSAEFGVLDMPDKAEDRIMGHKVDETSGITFIGEDSEPPYCAIILESDTLKGEKAVYALLKGKFSKDAVSLNTKEEGNVEPEPDSFSFSCIASDKKETKGQSVAKLIGDEKEVVKKMKELVFGKGEEGSP